MEVSELISELEEVEGDLDVLADDGKFGAFQNVDGVEVREDVGGSGEEMLVIV